MNVNRIRKGDKVSAPYKGDVDNKPGIVVDIMSMMVYIKFDDGTEDFVDKKDKRLKLLVPTSSVRKGKAARATVPHVDRKREAKKNGDI